uniref:Uncharacterized protein n=1 Tax=Anguilla anguilla TaxID=7936 RepID=A0A0E9X6A4_ANGAN
MTADFQSTVISNTQKKKKLKGKTRYSQPPSVITKHGVHLVWPVFSRVRRESRLNTKSTRKRNQLERVVTLATEIGGKISFCFVFSFKVLRQQKKRCFRVSSQKCQFRKMAASFTREG